MCIQNFSLGKGGWVGGGGCGRADTAAIHNLYCIIKYHVVGITVPQQCLRLNLYTYKYNYVF